MVIDKVTKCFLTRSDKPNENWTGDINLFVVEDETELAQKIITNYPYFDFVIVEGNLIDITPTERPPAPTPPPTTEQQILGIQDNFDIMYAQMLMLQGVTVSV